MVEAGVQGPGALAPQGVSSALAGSRGEAPGKILRFSLAITCKPRSNRSATLEQPGEFSRMCLEFSKSFFSFAH